MRFAWLECVRLAPLAQADDHVEQTLALGRQDVLLVRASFRDRRRLQIVVRDQGSQARGENILGHAQALLKLAEAAQAVERIADDQQGRAIGAVTSGVVFGIIAARSLAGPLAELTNWRTVYIGSAVLTLIATWALAHVLPRQRVVVTRTSYAQLLRSAPALLVQERLLRVRAGIALLLFAAFGVLWSSLALALAAMPLALSASAIGWFGLAGLAGVVGASCAGALADRGWGQWTSGFALALMLVAWWPISRMDSPLWVVFVGVAAFDLGGQAAHVTSQSLLFRARPDARNRLVAAYMLFYSTGIGLGALASTAVFASFGWRGVCLLGAATSASALLFWALTLEPGARQRCPSASIGRTPVDGISCHHDAQGNAGH